MLSLLLFLVYINRARKRSTINKENILEVWIMTINYKQLKERHFADDSLIHGKKTAKPYQFTFNGTWNIHANQYAQDQNNEN